MKNKRIMSWLIVILWMIIIFMVSHMPSDISYEASKEVISSVVGSATTNSTIFHGSMTFNKFIRKSAHIGEYFVLCLLIIHALTNYKITGKQIMIYSLITCFAYACSDEVHQYFVGRSATLGDIGIDMIGVIVCIGVFIILSSRVNFK